MNYLTSGRVVYRYPIYICHVFEYVYRSVRNISLRINCCNIYTWPIYVKFVHSESGYNGLCRMTIDSKALIKKPQFICRRWKGRPAPLHCFSHNTGPGINLPLLFPCVHQNLAIHDSRLVTSIDERNVPVLGNRPSILQNQTINSFKMSSRTI